MIWIQAVIWILIGTLIHTLESREWLLLLHSPLQHVSSLFCPCCSRFERKDCIQHSHFHSIPWLRNTLRYNFIFKFYNFCSVAHNIFNMWEKTIDELIHNIQDCVIQSTIVRTYYFDDNIILSTDTDTDAERLPRKRSLMLTCLQSKCWSAIFFCTHVMPYMAVS